MPRSLSLIDILLESPISFEDAWKRSRAVIVGGERVQVACPEDLLALKQSAGREEDREDIRVLKKIVELERWKKKKSWSTSSDGGRFRLSRCSGT
jgi:predicted nucleotidyltransferase